MCTFCVEARCQCFEQLPGYIQGICVIKNNFTCKRNTYEVFILLNP